jgi:hypothetical protein
VNLHGTLDGVTHNQNNLAFEAFSRGHQEVQPLNINNLPHFLSIKVRGQSMCASSDKFLQITTKASKLSNLNQQHLKLVNTPTTGKIHSILIKFPGFLEFVVARSPPVGIGTHVSSTKPKDLSNHLLK